MTDKQGHKVLTLDNVKFIILILCIVVPMAIGWGTQAARVGAIEIRQAAQEVKIEATDEVLLKIQVQLAGIQRDIMYIREQLDRRP